MGNCCVSCVELPRVHVMSADANLTLCAWELFIIYLKPYIHVDTDGMHALILCDSVTQYCHLQNSYLKTTQLCYQHIPSTHIHMSCFGAGKMAQQLRSLGTLMEGLG